MGQAESGQLGREPPSPTDKNNLGVGVVNVLMKLGCVSGPDACDGPEEAVRASPLDEGAGPGKIRVLFEPMRTWYGAPARAALKKKHGAYPATPEALATWKSFGPVTTAFLDDQGVAPGPVRARATTAGTRSKWHGWR